MPLRAPAKKGWLAHYSELLGVWRRKAHGHEDAEDAMHDAMVRLLESGSATADDPRAYLKRSTANGVIDRHRHQAVLPTTPLQALEETEHPLVAGPESTVYSHQLIGDLKTALEELPPVCQQVYLRHRLEGWTHAEIATAMGLSRAMVEKHMTRALQHLSRRLQHHAP